MRNRCENLSKLTSIMNIGHFSYILIPQKLDVNTFSGSISLWRRLRDSGPIEILLWCRRGL